MAFNPQVFKTRALTAILFVVVMMAGLFWNRWSFFILFSIVHFGAWFEYFRLIQQINREERPFQFYQKMLFILAGWCLLLFFTNQSLQIAEAHLTTIGWWVGLVMLILLPAVLVLQAKSLSFKTIGYASFGLIYISLSLGLLIDLRNHWEEEQADINLVIPLLTIFTLWVNDTMAYIVGSFIGKTPFSPISPKKTWEGTIGGVILAVVVMSLIAYFSGQFPVRHTAIVAAIVSITGTYGDLFESKLKRMAGVKDSGAIMPGHGGFLDRFDSLLFASIAAWLYVALFM